MLASCRAPAAVATRPRSRVCAAAASLQRVRALVPRTASSSSSAPLPGLAARPIGLPSCSPDAARRKVIAASFLGVGAPEALLVAVVALVVFGPKGLADAAKSLGGALRAFQPTIREVVEVSQDLRGTLEKELGLDEIREAARAPPPRPRAIPSDTATEDDPEIEAKRAASAAAAWSSGGAAEAPAAAPAPAPPTTNIPQQLEQPARDLGSMSVEELEAELARRKATAGGQQQA